MLKKGAITVNKNTSPYEYSPIVSEEEVKNYETKSFLHRIYNGSLSMLLSNFVREENLSNDEINELKKILDNNIKGE